MLRRRITAVYVIIMETAATAMTAPAAEARPLYRDSSAHKGSIVLTLDDCLSMSLQKNNSIRNAELDVLAAKAQKGEALAEYFPSVSVNALAYYAFDPLLRIGVDDILGNSDLANSINELIQQLAPVLGFDPVYSTLKKGYSATVSVVQPVFAGGRIVSGNRLASIGVEAAELSSSVQQRKSTEEIERQYWQVISLEEKMQTLDSAWKMLDSVRKDVDAAVEAGLVTEADRLQVRLRQSELKTTRSKLTGGLRLAKMNLCNAAGVPYTPYSTIGTDSRPHIDSILFSRAGLDSLFEPSAYWEDENSLLSSREESKLLDLSVKAARLEKRMTLGEVLPQLGVGLSYGYSNIMLNDARFNGAVFAALKIPITDWGKYSRRLERYGYQVSKAENDREYLSGQLLLQVRQQWLELTVCWEQLLVAEESVVTAKAVVDDLTSHYRAGLVPLSDLLQAQTTLRQCADTLVDARIAYRNAIRAYAGR